MSATELSSGLRAVAYARVSTLLGQDPELQLVALRQFAQARGFVIVKEIVDKGISGAKERRPGLDELVRDAQRGRYKVILVSALDRLARDTRHLLNLIHELSAYRVAVISIRENIDFTTPIGQASLAILGAIATLEREITRDRIRNALAAKRITAEQTGSGWRCGRPTLLSPALERRVKVLRDEGKSLRAIERQLKTEGIIASRMTIMRILRGRR